MILADKIINERKKNGWSQEELAEQLSVSRQSVSKWEGAQAVPDLQKIIAMADIFGVSTDYLLKDEIEPDNKPSVVNEVVEYPAHVNVRRVTLEEASDYLQICRQNAPRIAMGVSMCILSPTVLILLSGLSESGKFGISENVAVVIGMVVLFILVALAVAIFILSGAKTKHFEFLDKEIIETAYGVDGMVLDRKKTMEGSRAVSIAIGVILCIVGVVPLVIAGCLEVAEYIIVAMVSVLLIIVAVAVYMFVKTGIEYGSCEKLLQEGEYTKKNKFINMKLEPIAGIYWGLVVAGYLAWSFISMRWDFTWIVWPIAAIAYGAISSIFRFYENSKYTQN